MKRAVFVYHATLTILLLFAIASTFLVVLAESKTVEQVIFKFVPSIGVQASSDERQQVSYHIRSFLVGKDDLPDELFTSREQMHMEDVRGLLAVNKNVAVWAVFICGLCLIFFRQVNLRRVFVNVGWVLVLLPALLLSGVLVGFSELFIRFHEIVFSNDLWLLDPTKHALIRVYPPAFFQIIVTIYGVMLMVLGGFLIIQRKLEKKK